MKKCSSGMVIIDAVDSVFEALYFGVYRFLLCFHKGGWRQNAFNVNYLINRCFIGLERQFDQGPMYLEAMRACIDRLRYPAQLDSFSVVSGYTGL